MEVVTQLQQAAALYQGDFMDEFSLSGSGEWDDWQQFRRIEFQYQATQIFAALAHYYTDRQLADSGLRMAGRWLELDPLNEEAHRLKMRLYALSRQAERAIEQYHLLARLLTRDQGRQPEAQTQTLYAHIRSGNFASSPFDMPTARTIRAILPKLAPTSSDYQSQGMQIKRALGIVSDPLPTPLVAVYDATGSISPALIAQLTHERDVQGAYPDGILWAVLDDDIEAVLRLWMDALRISILKSTSKVEHLAWQLHNGLRDKRVLIILERIAHEDQAYLLTPGYPGCSLLVTTVHPQVASGLRIEPNKLIIFNAVARDHK